MSMNSPRTSSLSALLLLAACGGADDTPPPAQVLDPVPVSILVEVYDPVTDTFTPIVSMGTPRTGHTATRTGICHQNCAESTLHSGLFAFGHPIGRRRLGYCAGHIFIVLCFIGRLLALATTKRQVGRT